MSACRRLGVAASIALSSAADAQQHLGGGAPADVSLVRVFLSLFVCLILAGLAILFIRQRYGGRLPAALTRIRSGVSRLRFVESRRIGAQADLCLVECDDQEYLLLMTPGGPLLLKQSAVSRDQAN